MRSTSLCQILAVTSFDSAPDAYNHMKSVRQANPTLAMSTPDATTFGRRKALHHLWGRAFAVVASIPVVQALNIPEAEALDMDAFANSQLENDSKNCNPKLDPKCFPTLTQDEGLCKYGQSGSTARAEACKRVKAAGGEVPSGKPEGKSLGGAYAM